MSEIDLDALERLAEAATPGPWHCHKKDEERGEFLMDFGGMFDADGNHTGRPAMIGWISLRDRDAPYIAAANPDTVRALIDHIRALEAERDAYKAQANLYEHMVITCGVAATHSDAELTRTGAYAEKWNSQQAEQVRALRAERDALRADAALYAGTVRIEYNDVYVAACRRQGVGPDSFDVYLEKCRAIDRAAIAAKEPNRE